MRVERAYEVKPRELFDVLVDPHFLRARGERFGGTAEPTVDRSGSRVIVTTPRALPLENLPGGLRKLVGDGSLVQVDTWTDVTDDLARGTWIAEAPGVPLDLSGDHDVSATRPGARYAVTARIKVHIPLVGGRLEKTVAEHLSELVRRELDFAAEWLASPSPHREA